jgi:DeoR/GlpR family transcriptional regulator of sugar metabolism
LKQERTCKSPQSRHCPRAAELIQPGQVVIVDGGTTTAEMMRLLPADLACTVVTHSPGIAVALVDHPRIEVILIGGRLFKHSVVASGRGAGRYGADQRRSVFMGVTGVHPGRVSPPVIMKKRASSARWRRGPRKPW